MGQRDVDQIIAAWRAQAQGTGDPGGGEPGEPGRERWSRPVRAALAALLLLPLLVLVAAVVTRPSPGPAPEPAPPAAQQADQDADPRPTPPPLPKVADWLGLLQQVDLARAQAYASGDPEPLQRLMAGPALDTERAALAAMREQGVSAEGWSTTISSVSPRSLSVERAELLVGDERGAYALVSADGTRTEVPAAGHRKWSVVLQPGPFGWQVVQAEEVTSPGSLP